MANINKWLAYAVFSVAVLILLLYCLFPSESVARYVVSKASKISPDLRVSIGQVFPTFPPGLSFVAVRIAYDDVLLLETEVIRAFPRLISVFSPRRTIFFKLHTRDGFLDGRADIIRSDQNKPPAFDISISGMQLADIPLIKTQSGFELSGVLKLDIHWENRSTAGSATSVRIEVSDCELQVQNPLLLQDRFSFDRVEADVYVHDGRVELKECHFAGDPIDATIFGYGILQYPLNKSKIELSAQISPHRQFLKHPGGSVADDIVNLIESVAGDISVLVRGTIENPTFSIN